MKTQNNIEKKLADLKESYKVPENYFEQLVKDNLRKEESAKIVPIKKYISKMMVAASILVLVSFSFIQYTNMAKRSSNQPLDTINNQHQTTSSSDLLDGISDDDIVEYIIDDTDIESYIEP